MYAEFRYQLVKAHQAELAREADEARLAKIAATPNLSGRQAPSLGSVLRRLAGSPTAA